MLSFESTLNHFCVFRRVQQKTIAATFCFVSFLLNPYTSCSNFNGWRLDYSNTCTKTYGGKLADHMFRHLVSAHEASIININQVRVISFLHRKFSRLVRYALLLENCECHFIMISCSLQYCCHRRAAPSIPIR